MAEKKKSGRPPIETNEKITKEAIIGLKQSDYETLQLRAKNANISFSEYCRKILLETNPTIIQKKFPSKETERTLAGIGNNLNQIAKHLNKEGVTFENIEIAKDQLYKIEQLIFENMI